MTARRTTFLFTALGLLTAALFIADLAVGSVAVPLGDVWAALTGGSCDPATSDIILKIRLLKAVTALFAGAALAAGGLEMQTLFRNPLAGPYVLGVSSGAGLGVALFLLGAPLLGVAGHSFVRSLGVAGAAIATVFGQTVGTCLGIFFNVTKNKEVDLNMKGFRPDPLMIKEIYSIGVPSIIMQAVGSIMVFGMNMILVSFSTTAVATFGAYFKLQSFVFMPIFGMNNGVVPIIAYNYGAQKPGRIRQCMKISVNYAVAFMGAGTLIFWLIPGVLMSLFDPSPVMMALGMRALRTISLCFPFAGYAIMRGSVFQALGKSVYSMNISLIRQLGILLPAAWILGRIAGVNAVWFAFPIAEIMGTTLSALYTRKIRRDIIDRIPDAEQQTAGASA